MTTAISELELFHRFISEKLQNGGKGLGLDEALLAFRAYQEEIASLRAAIQPALERARRGESKPYDPEDLKARVTAELLKKGIKE